MDAPFEVVFRSADDGGDMVKFQNIEESTSTSFTDPSVKSSASETYRNMATESVSSSPMHLEEDSPLRETHSDPFNKPRWLREASSLSVIIASMIIFCVGITIAMIIQIIVGAPQVTPHAGVLSDDSECSKIGLKVLSDSSSSRLSDYPATSAVDAAIATSLCLMIKNVHKGGLGGGGFMLIEKQHEKKRDTMQINFREMSPAATDVNLNTRKDSLLPGQSIAVPGVLKGMQLAHSLFGRVKWKDLFLKASALAASGVGVTEELEEAISTLDLASTPDDLKNLVTKDDNVTLLTKNDTLKQPELAETLKILAENPDSFYKGQIAKALVDIANASGSRMQLSDLRNYKAESNNEVMKVKYGNMDIAASGVPSSGPVLLSTLNFMSKYPIMNNVSSDYLSYHRMLEALKFSYGYQSAWENSSQVNASLTGTTPLDDVSDDKAFNIDHYMGGVQPLDLNVGGEQHVTVIGNDRLVVTVVMGVGSPFGSKIMSSGILLNNAMLDFSWPGKNTENPSLQPSQANLIAGGRRPISSMTAALVLPNNTKCGLYIGFDVHEGTQANSALVQTIIRKAAGYGIAEGINKPRINQNMIPYTVQAEEKASSDLVNFLTSLGHNVTRTKTLGVCSALSYIKENIQFYPDSRDEEDSARMF